jgi:hypothetical protein
LLSSVVMLRPVGAICDTSKHDAVCGTTFIWRYELFEHLPGLCILNLEFVYWCWSSRCSLTYPSILHRCILPFWSGVYSPCAVHCVVYCSVTLLPFVPLGILLQAEPTAWVFDTRLEHSPFLLEFLHFPCYSFLLTGGSFCLLMHWCDALLFLEVHSWSPGRLPLQCYLS